MIECYSKSTGNKLCGQKLVTILEDSLILVSYIDYAFLSLFDISDVYNPVFLDRFETSKIYYML